MKKVPLKRSNKPIARKPLKNQPQINKTPIKKVGKKTNQWITARAKLRHSFNDAGIFSCELRYEDCTEFIFLGFAHSKKRVDIKGDEIYDVILACTGCHEKIERLPRKEMYERVMSVISSRVYGVILNK
jgi:hypothetical protein